MEVSKKKSLRSSAMLALTALIWGVAFVAQSEGMNYVCLLYTSPAGAIQPDITGLRVLHCMVF